MAKTLYLAKADDRLLSHCACRPAEALITSPPQMDCPWCGCGWLFTCIACRKAFTFARTVETDHSLAELAEMDLRGGGFKATKSAVRDWVGLMSEFLDGIEPGEEYVVLDYTRIPTDYEPPVQFRGVYADHDLPWIPHLRALDDPAVIDDLLGSEAYWLERRYEDDDQEEEP